MILRPISALVSVAIAFAVTATVAPAVHASDNVTCTVKAVWADGVSATTRVKPTRTGSWRYHYAGDDISGASNSKSVTIVVPRR